MVENTTEQKRFSDVGPDEVRDRIMGFFDGADITRTGQHRNGLMLIDVRRRGTSVDASINGISLASIEVDLDQEETTYTLFGSDKHLNPVQFYIVYPDGEEQASEFALIRESEAIIDPQDQHEVTQVLMGRKSHLR